MVTYSPEDKLSFVRPPTRPATCVPPPARPESHHACYDWRREWAAASLAAWKARWRVRPPHARATRSSTCVPSNANALRKLRGRSSGKRNALRSLTRNGFAGARRGPSHRLRQPGRR
jgi:hypothetical protein